MTSFHAFLRARLAAGGFTTEDALTAFLPLVRETLQAHAAGLVAPLEGLDALQVAAGRIWFPEGRRQAVRTSPGMLRLIEAAAPAAVEVVAEVRRSATVGEADAVIADLALGDRDAPVTRPVYLPGYVAWEHHIEHHDPLTDVFSLGLILASLACGLDLCEPNDLKRFVEGRRNLFALQPDLHPVLAQAIFRTTPLDRHRRVQDLQALLFSLEHYREQPVGLGFDLAAVPDAGAGPDVRHRKHTVVLSKLRERLFEISRRNRLLHFRPTLQTLNLTEASVPLAFDIHNIRPEQLMLWSEPLHAAVVGGAAISLNKFLNFAEALYLPAVLDHILAEAKRDQAEFGFAQLRLAVCFLHWANLKESPPEHFDSPLVLLPVEVKRKKGVRDTYWLEVLSTEAEINPVLRHLFKQLYDIGLPETIDLATTTLDEFFAQLAARIQASEPAVTLSRLDRPRIALLHDKARRRLDQYTRRARLAGRGVRSFLDLDYSYDPANYHPLGVRLFSARIRPPETRLRGIIEERPRPRSFAAPDEAPPVVEKERTFFSLQSGAEENPYVWNFDLCRVTLGNFKYRKMSLVRDYEALLAEMPANPAFDATFSLAPRDPTRPLPTAPPLEDRYYVVACDPTQASAIEEARAGRSYIIQGPPGTGKSQTITNLIADYAARGKRVLFVCEKRAAIDVVYARLRQRGLGDLCCLIHDTQTDKRDFVMDLKQTYEAVLAESASQAAGAARKRRGVVKQLQDELRALELFDAAMQQNSPALGLPVRHLLRRCIELREALPKLSALEQERLPDYGAWWLHRERIHDLVAGIRALQPDGILAHHPLRLLAPRLARADRPLETVTNALAAAERSLAEVERTLGRCGPAGSGSLTCAQAQELVACCCRLLPVARCGQLGVLDARSREARQFTTAAKQFQAAREAWERSRARTCGWRQKLPREELAAALPQARAFEKSFAPWLRWAWWRLRSVLHRAYDLRQHAVRPKWSQVLATLQREYDSEDALNGLRGELAAKFHIDGDVDAWMTLVAEWRESSPRLPEWLGQIVAGVRKSERAGAILEQAAAAHEPLAELAAALEPISVGHAERTLEQLSQDLRRLFEALDELPAFLRRLEELSTLPEALGTALRTLPLPPDQLEAAMAHRSVAAALAADRTVQAFTGADRDRHALRLERLYDRWLESNAAEVRRRVHRRFLEHVQISNLSASQLTDGQKEFKRQYSRGRRELEHEFGKTMRYRSIRDLASADSGPVLHDLKPVWLMSPLSVSDTLPLDPTCFDVVIFDEASQIPLEEAVPALFRARQAVVVGDEMQLPPTDFFSAKRGGEDEEELLVEDDGELVQYDLEGNSFLSHAAKNLPSTMLGWHYRSRSESLVSFSNWAFYDGRLLSVPEEQVGWGADPAGRPATPRPPAKGSDVQNSELAAGPCCDGETATPPILDSVQRSPAPTAPDGERGADALLARSVSFHRLAHGVYDKRRNRAEAEYIAELVRALLRRGTGLSLGIIAFSEAQQEEIEAALQRLAQADDDFAPLLEAEYDREVDGQFVGLLVKNLENIQGDERDIVILSICYGHGPNGKMLMNFGPINKSGGEKRLNVAFSRSKHHMAVVTSIQALDITNDYNDGAACLKNYLRYAAAVSEGRRDEAQRVLRGMSRWQNAADDRDEAPADPVAEELADALAERGFLVERDVGESHFRCDLAVCRPGDAVYRLGILLDNDGYYEQSDLLEREMMRPRLLREFGWRVAVVLAKDWHSNRGAVLTQLLERLEGADDACGDAPSEGGAPDEEGD